MPNFKPKTLKKISVDEKKTITLDGKHTEIINKFNKELYEDIPKLKNQIQEKKKKNTKYFHDRRKDRIGK